MPLTTQSTSSEGEEGNTGGNGGEHSGEGGSSFDEDVVFVGSVGLELDGSVGGIELNVEEVADSIFEVENVTGGCTGRKESRGTGGGCSTQSSTGQDGGLGLPGEHDSRL